MPYVINEIPLPLLLKQGHGDFVKLDQTLEDKILDYIPKNQSAFDSVLPAVMRAYQHDTDVLEVPGIEEVINDVAMNGVLMSGRAGGDTERIIELILHYGINEGNMLQQRWVAAQGPMPVNVVVSFDGQTVSAAGHYFLCMALAYYKIIDLLRIIAIDQEYPDDVMSGAVNDVRLLCKSWEGVHGWSY